MADGCTSQGSIPVTRSWAIWRWLAVRVTGLRVGLPYATVSSRRDRPSVLRDTMCSFVGIGSDLCTQIGGRRSRKTQIAPLARNQSRPPRQVPDGHFFGSDRSVKEFERASTVLHSDRDDGAERRDARGTR